MSACSFMPLSSLGSVGTIMIDMLNYHTVISCSNQLCIFCCVQAEVKLMMKTWSDLYVNFVRLSAMVANTEPNCGCEQLMSRVLSFISQLPADVCLTLSVCLYLSLSVHPSVCFSAMVSNTEFNCVCKQLMSTVVSFTCQLPAMYFSLSVCLCVCLSVCLYLSVCLCVSVCLDLFSFCTSV